MRRACDCSPPMRIAGADGLFIAKEVGGDSVDLIKLFDLHSRAGLRIGGKTAAVS